MATTAQLITKLERLRDKAFELGADPSLHDTEYDAWHAECVTVLTEVFGESSDELQRMKPIPLRLTSITGFEQRQLDEVRAATPPGLDVTSRNEACRRIFTDAAEALLVAIRELKRR